MKILVWRQGKEISGFLCIIHYTLLSFMQLKRVQFYCSSFYILLLYILYIKKLSLVFYYNYRHKKKLYIETV
jgi:hypothetical protein